MKKEYIIVGDNNFWYASCIETLKEAKAQVKEIMKNGKAGYGCALCDQEPCCEPETLYIYEAKEIKQITK